MSVPQKQRLTPLETDPTWILIIGTLAWFVAFLVMLILHDALADAGHSDWLWIALAGWILGLMGMVLTRLQRKAGGDRRGQR